VRPIRTILAALAAIAPLAHSWADEGSEARAGRELAAKLCSPCHLVSPAVGPSFAEIAKGSKAEPEALRDFLNSTQSTVGHPSTMPRLDLTEHEIEQISAYLQTLRKAK